MKNMQMHITKVSICRRLYIDTSMICICIFFHMQSLHNSAHYMLSRSEICCCLSTSVPYLTLSRVAQLAFKSQNKTTKQTGERLRILELTQTTLLVFGKPALFQNSDRSTCPELLKELHVILICRWQKGREYTYGK